MVFDITSKKNTPPLPIGKGGAFLRSLLRRQEVGEKGVYAFVEIFPGLI